MLLLQVLASYLRAFIGSKRGEITLGMIIVFFVILVAYMAYPQAFYDFFNYLRRMVFDSLHDSFGNQQGGKKKPGGLEMQQSQKQR